MKNLIIGLGTGRCGTTSLTDLLSIQNNSLISHEMKGNKPLPWLISNKTFISTMENINAYDAKFVGDVALFWLPYVAKLVNYDPNTKFIIIKRDKQKVIDSFNTLTGWRNPWYKHTGTKEWFALHNLNSLNHKHGKSTFPKYSIPSKRKCISKYYDEYYEECKNVKNSYWIDTEDLNDESKMLDMLEFCGYKDPIYKKMVSNQGKDRQPYIRKRT